MEQNRTITQNNYQNFSKVDKNTDFIHRRSSANHKQDLAWWDANHARALQTRLVGSEEGDSGLNHGQNFALLQISPKRQRAVWIPWLVKVSHRGLLCFWVTVCASGLTDRKWCKWYREQLTNEEEERENRLWGQTHRRWNFDIWQGPTDCGKERLLNTEAWEHAVLATGWKMKLGSDLTLQATSTVLDTRGGSRS